MQLCTIRKPAIVKTDRVTTCSLMLRQGLVLLPHMLKAPIARHGAARPCFGAHEDHLGFTIGTTSSTCGLDLINEAEWCARCRHVTHWSDIAGRHHWMDASVAKLPRGLLRSG